MKFRRTDYGRFSKLGKNRKKLQKWRAAKGRDNKIREKRKNYPISPNIGYKRSKKESGRINGKLPVRVMNLKELENVGKENIAIIGRIGARKRIELLKRADEMKISVLNINRGGRNEAK